jgi:hypothetical protein
MPEDSLTAIEKTVRLCPEGRSSARDRERLETGRAEKEAAIMKRERMEPNWKPLEGRLGKARCAGFMFMGRTNGINLYKHGISRRYLNLDDEGHCYVYIARDCLASADFERELAILEDDLRGLQATLETPYDEEFMMRKMESLAQQGISLLTFQVEPEDT